MAKFEEEFSDIDEIFEASNNSAKPKNKGGKHLLFKILKITGVTVLVLLLAVSGFGIWAVTASFPQTSGKLSVEGLQHPVEVLRSSDGVPTIIAQTDHDLFFSQGFVHAQDRFWEMDFRRHVTSGRLSELFGESQLGTDTFIRTLGWRKIAEEETAMLDAESRALYQAYSDGVNAYLSQRSGVSLSLEYGVLALINPGYEPEPWQIADSVAWLKAMAWDLRSNLSDEIERAQAALLLTAGEYEELFPEFPFNDNPVIVPDSVRVQYAASAEESSADEADESDSAEVAELSFAPQLEELQQLLRGLPAPLSESRTGIGSNSWVVSGKYTDTGKPLLANDPHLSASMPSIWHQVNLMCKELTSDCSYRVSGFSFSGLPGVIIGHNESIGWGFTNLGPDVADLYLEKVTGDTYLLDGQQQPLKTRTETIAVSGSDPVQIEIRSTHRGPIVSGALDSIGAIAEDPGSLAAGDPDRGSGYEISLRWTALEAGTTPMAVFAMNKAHNWEEFRAAAALFEVPAQNLVYADTQGNIGYQAPGKIPIRNQGDGTAPVPGWSSDYDWLGYIPFDELPSSLNPAEGYIATANNAVVGDEYPHLLTVDWDYGYRALRIVDMLEERLPSGSVTAAELAAMQADNFNWIASKLVPHLKNLPVKPETAEALTLLESWNYQDHADSAAAAYFNVLWKNLLHETVTQKYPELEPGGGSKWFLIVAGWLDNPDSTWWQNRALGLSGMEQFLTQSADLAYDELRELQGSNPNNWNWGKLHALTLTHASLGTSGIGPIEWLFNRGPFPTGGGSSIVNATGWTPHEGYHTQTVPSLRMVIDFANFDDSTWNHLTGNSGHAFHPNYDDLVKSWQAAEQTPWLFSLATLRESSREVLELSPQG